MPLFFRVVYLFLLFKLHVTQSLLSIVSGANGYVGRALVHELLEESSLRIKGGSHEVICLVRPHRVQSEQDYWNRYCSKGSYSVVRVLPYDMLDGGKTVRQALESCSQKDEERCFFHLASVFGPTKDHKQTALDNVKGTEDLVYALSEEKNNWKLILTSLMAAVRGSGQEPSNGKFYTHKDWNTVSQLGANWGASYQWSKAQSELRCKELCEKYGIPLIVLNPSFVFGPASQPDATSSYSLTLVGQWVRGKSQVQSRLFVDVRDVALAHVAAALRPDAVGKRYILSTEARVPSQELACWLQEVCREKGLTAAEAEKIDFDANFDGGAISIGEKEVDATDRLRDELGITLTPVKDTIMDMARVLLEESTSI